jgi:hypothetical protein
MLLWPMSGNFGPSYDAPPVPIIPAHYRQATEPVPSSPQPSQQSVEEPQIQHAVSRPSLHSGASTDPGARPLSTSSTRKCQRVYGPHDILRGAFLQSSTGAWRASWFAFWNTWTRTRTRSQYRTSTIFPSCNAICLGVPSASNQYVIAWREQYAFHTVFTRSVYAFHLTCSLSREGSRCRVHNRTSG